MAAILSKGRWVNGWKSPWKGKHLIYRDPGHDGKWLTLIPVAYFIEEVRPILAKPQLNFCLAESHHIWYWLTNINQTWLGPYIQGPHLQTCQWNLKLTSETAEHLWSVVQISSQNLPNITDKEHHFLSFSYGMHISSGPFPFNSLWPNDATWQQRSGSTLAQVMACCLTAPSHYLNQCWLIISEVQWHSY